MFLEDILKIRVSEYIWLHGNLIQVVNQLSLAYGEYSGGPNYYWSSKGERGRMESEKKMKQQKQVLDEENWCV